MLYAKQKEAVKMNIDPNLFTQLEAKRGQPFSRRELLRYSLAGTAGLMLADKFNLYALAAEAQAPKPLLKGKAKSVIQVFLWGGMSHSDTWDPKPDAGYDYTGQFAATIACLTPSIVSP